MKKQPESLHLIYGPEDKPKNWKDGILYSLQWIMIMVYPVIWGYAIVGKGLNLDDAVLAEYMGRIVLMIGLSTLIQTIAGHKLSMISGPNIIPSLAIVAAYEVGGEAYALASFNAFIIAGIVVALLGVTGILNTIGKVWTPLTQGSMILMVGLATSFSGMELLAVYGVGWAYYVGIFLALVCGFLSIKGKGILATIPVLIVIVLGYIIFMVQGTFNWELVETMPTILIPKLFPFGMTMPPLDLIITMIIVHFFSAINVYGNVQGYVGLLDLTVSPKRKKKLFTVFGLIEGSLAGILGVPGYAPYGENLGFLLLTKVASRYFIIISSVIVVFLSFFGKIAGLMAAIPEPVAGAVLLGVASTLIGIGIDSSKKSVKFETREIFIVGFSIFFALGTSRLSTEFFKGFPRIVGTIMSNPVILVIILVILLEQIIFRERKKLVN
ncbi:uracil-xanthine permease family protein [Carnobacterium iners]|nr:solute carrier family 23 protein [Carnobacterium iners]